MQRWTGDSKKYKDVYRQLVFTGKNAGTTEPKKHFAL